MRRISHADDPEAVRLREALAGELVALRQAFTTRTREAAAGGELAGQIAGQIGTVLRENPAWAAGAAAGAVAGLAAAVRRRIRRSPDNRPAL